ncbi:unnamed protein product, partial [Rotaria sp. Silwood2]
MTESASEQMMPLNMSLYDIRKNNQINKYFKFHNNITTINQMGSYGITALHVVNIYEYNEAVQLLLTNSTLKSFENTSYQLTSYDESKMNEIKKLFLKNSNLFHSLEEIIIMFFYSDLLLMF